MPLYPIFFILVLLFGTYQSFKKGPVWGLMVYIFVYFNIPDHQWWGNYVPQIRWSLFTAGLLILSCARHKHHFIRKPEKNYPFRHLVAILIITVLVVPLSEFPAIAWEKVYEFFRYVLIFYLIYKVVDDFKKFKLFMYTFIYCTFNLSLLARHYFTGTRLEGIGVPDASEANMFAALILLVIPSLITFILHGSRNEKILAVIASPFIVNAFMMTRSRGGFIGLIVELLLMLLFVFRTVKRDHLLRILAGTVIICSLFLSLMDPQFKSRIFNIGDQTDTDNLDAVSSGRIEMWGAGFELFKDNPFGTGGGTYQLLIPDYISQRDTDTRATASHNTFLLIMVEQGMMGLIFYLLFLRKTFSISKQITANLKNEEDPSLASLMHHNVALGAGLAGFLAAGFFVERIYFEGIYLIAALIPCLYQIRKFSQAKMAEA